MLIDQFGRSLKYLRVSVTDRCDLRCKYCLPKGFKGFYEPKNWLNFDEITRVVAAFTRLGVQHVRLTGGEPLLRRHLSTLAAMLAELSGLDDLSITTNGTQLAQYADDLHQCGVARLNVSLDSLRRERVLALTGNDCLEKVLQGLDAAKAAGFSPIKINMVPLAGVNDDEIEEMMEFCMHHHFILRLIETMPIGHSGKLTQGVNLTQIMPSLLNKFALTAEAYPSGAGPARYWSSDDGRFTVGVITPISQHFCAACNRVRLSADGTLYPCLGQEDSIALRPVLRDGCGDAELEAIIRTAIALKPQRHEFNEQPDKIIRYMSVTGG